MNHPHRRDIEQVRESGDLNSIERQTNVSTSREEALSTSTLDKLYLENTLLRISGALFCHDAKRAHRSVDKIEINRGISDRALTIEPHPEFGRPGPLAHKLFVAIVKKHSDYGRPIQSEVTFSRREIMRLAGRSKWGGRDSGEFTDALQQIHRTFITANFKAADGLFIEESFNVFPRVLVARRSSATDPIEACIVTLADPIIASLKDDHFTCLNHTLMQKLGTIGQALYMRLFFHFANLHDGHHSKRLRFEKRYDAICTEWLGGLTVHTKRSAIERVQLGGHLRQLVEEGFLVSYAIEPMATAGETGFKIAFRPGPAFFADYDRFYRHRSQGELQWDFHGDRQEISEPLKLAYLFIEKRDGQPLNGAMPYVVTKDVETARELLRKMPFDEASSFLDFGLAEARKTRFDVRTLSGLKQYLAAFAEHRRRRETSKTAAAAREARNREEALQSAYERFRRQQAEIIFEQLSVGERAAIEALARSAVPQFADGAGTLASMLVANARMRQTAERHDDQIQSFDAWKASRAVHQTEPA